jgi:hypothetical protein
VKFKPLDLEWPIVPNAQFGQRPPVEGADDFDPVSRCSGQETRDGGDRLSIGSRPDSEKDIVRKP